MSLVDLVRKAKNIKDTIRTSLIELKITAFRNKKYDSIYEEARILILAHSLEKGMGLPNVNIGYGKDKAQKLCDALIKYNKIMPSNTSYTFIEGIGIMKMYIRFQKDNGVVIDDIQKKYDSLYNKLTNEQKEKIEKYKCGYEIIEKRMFLDDIKKADFERIISTRRSVREFTDAEVKKKDVLEAIRLANYAPSACNRQPIKVYFTLGEDSSRKINDNISGNKSFTQNVKNFAVITADRAYFSGEEQYQWYINGGIYLAYFIESLHVLGIGSCVMQWFAFSKNEKKLKGLLGIRNSEAIIAVVSLGYYAERFKCICAQRREVDEMVSFT